MAASLEEQNDRLSNHDSIIWIITYRKHEIIIVSWIDAVIARHSSRKRFIDNDAKENNFSPPNPSLIYQDVTAKIVNIAAAGSASKTASAD